MYLMSHPAPMDKQQFLECKQVIYHEVYTGAF